MTSEVRFTVLGTVRAWRAGTELHTGPPRQQALLAVLLASAGLPVSLPEMVSLLWGGSAPPTAANVVRRHIGSVRRMIEPALPRMASGQWLVGGGGGYRVNVDARSLDLLRFRELYTQARAARDTGRRERAVENYAEALQLWRGPAAAGVGAEVRGHPLFTHLDNERLTVAKEAADLALRLGDVEPILVVLQALTDQHRLDEPLHSRLILALSKAGRQAEALEVFHGLRDRLHDELGVGPSAGLSQAHQQVLAGALLASPPPGTAEQPGLGSTPSPFPRPAQLPAAPFHFVGRDAEVDHLLSQFASADRAAPAARALIINAIGGMAGVGKTTLALHLAHQVADRYPDGQLYVNLRGFDLNGSAMAPAEAIRGFLENLGIPPRRIPDELDAQAALYRSLLATRRVLVLLDNARDAEQVRPLLPGSAGSLVLITSRNQLGSLVAAHGAHPLRLDVMSAENARETLVRRLGADRVDSEPEATETIISLCGRLPLALSVIAARVLMNPHLPLSAMAAQLQEADGSLDAFHSTDHFSDVRAVFDWSYRTLSDATARLFRLLSLHPGATFDTRSAAALAGLTLRTTRTLLDQLVRAHLVTMEEHDRHRLHDLLRAYGREATDTHDTGSDRSAAKDRLFQHYLGTAHAALRQLDPARAFPHPLLGEPVTADTAPDSPEAAVRWFRTERLTLTELVRQVVRDDRPGDAWRLARLLDPMYERVGHWHDWADLQLTALEAARRSGEATGLAHAHAGLGRAHSLLRRYGSAEEHLQQALVLFETLGDDMGQAHCLRMLGWVMTRTERDLEAIDCTRRALDLYRIAGHVGAQADCLNAIAWFHAALGAHDEAVTSAVRSLLLHRRTSDTGGSDQANAWDTLAFAHHHLGNLARARLCYERAIRLLRAGGDRYNEAGSINRLGDTLALDGDLETARARWSEAVGIIAPMDPDWASEIREKVTARSR
ncbi:BTAD domain-containing putative transcriptional regulator [Streptomyces sp. ME02-8801-2C]|uniref:AfsR/SARP family transcriptional regulator n=1 Tax=Streptomyces sp. ME02-8801-2C TaxID=3028680 RepID=UPI0029B6E2EA|nr:BTAD domain-containing putative transcriptional regulator [Streptomyces sp. ME02-8801-2C]MDX3458331.1 BTAD domain-containing putative transcriptional regulator [Streptomyces sp. ME02-8801-2C]